MKELKIKNFEFNGNKKEYTIHFYGAVKLRYQSKREMQYKLAEISREMTDHLESINEVYRETIGITQMYIFSLDREELRYYNGRKDSIDTQIHYLLHLYDGKENQYYFHTVIGIAESVSIIIEKTIKSCKRQIEYTPVHATLKSFQKNLKWIMFQIRNMHRSEEVKLDYLQAKLNEENT
jgi:hypothetical protein